MDRNKTVEELGKSLGLSAEALTRIGEAFMEALFTKRPCAIHMFHLPDGKSCVRCGEAKET